MLHISVGCFGVYKNYMLNGNKTTRDSFTGTIQWFWAIVCPGLVRRYTIFYRYLCANSKFTWFMPTQVTILWLNEYDNEKLIRSTRPQMSRKIFHQLKSSTSYVTILYNIVGIEKEYLAWYDVKKWPKSMLSFPPQSLYDYWYPYVPALRKKETKRLQVFFGNDNLIINKKKYLHRFTSTRGPQLLLPSEAQNVHSHVWPLSIIQSCCLYHDSSMQKLSLLKLIQSDSTNRGVEWTYDI